MNDAKVVTEIGNSTTDGNGSSVGYTHVVDIVWGSVGLILGIYAIVANMLLIYVFMKLKRKGSVTDIIFLQLAVLDCLSGSAGVFGSIFLLNDRNWFENESILADIICYPAGMLWNMASLTTPLLLSSASIGRVLAVYLPFTYEKIFRFRTVFFMMIYCWSHGFFGACITFLGPNRYVKAYKMEVDWGFCDQNINASFNNEILRKFLYISLFTVPVIVSCSSIITCNLLVAIKITIMKINSARKNTQQTHSTTDTFFNRNVTTVLNKLRPNYNSTDFPKGQPTRHRSSITSGCSVANTPLDEISIANITGSPKMPRVKNTNPRNGFLSEQKDKRLEKQAKRENQAILMTLLLSCNYFICYAEIIHYYVIVSMDTNNFESYYKPIFKNVTYVYLWYYFSLFVAAAINPLLHMLFNPNVKKFLRGAKPSIISVSSSL